MFDNQKSRLLFSALIFIFLFSFAFPATVLADQGTPPAGPSVGDPSAHKRVPPSAHAAVANAVTALSNSGSVLSESGQVIPLGSVIAAQILSQPLPDPVVCPTGSANASAPGCVSGYTTISSAITAASAGSVIFVESGTYTEQVVIDKSLTLMGAGSASTTIKAPSILVPDLDGNLDVVVIEGSTTVANISGFTITGPGPAGCGSIHYGIYVRGGATVNIHSNVITNIADNPLGGCQNGVAIRVGSQAKGQTGKATITNNTISDYQKGGIVIDNTGSYADISNNTVQGIGNTPAIAQNGIQISRGATATITNNSISGNLCDHVSCGLNLDQSAGILLYNSGSVTIKDNTVFNNDVGLYSLAPGNTVSVNGNTFSGNRYEGVFADQGTLNLNGNTMTGGDYGLWAYSYNSASGNTNVNLTNNQIEGNSLAGIQIDEDLGVSFHPSVSGSGNAFIGNGNAVVNDTTTLAEFPNNWWGNANGPLDDKTTPSACGLTTNNPGGLGGAVSPCVLYNPWLTKNPFAGGGTGGGAGGIVIVSPIIPITGGEPTQIACDVPSMMIQIGDDQVTLTGLCGYDVVLEQVLKDDLPGNLGQGNNFVEGISLNLLKDGKAVDALPAGASIQVSYPKPSGNASILAWTGFSWVERPSSVMDDRVVANLGMPATNVLVTH